MPGSILKHFIAHSHTHTLSLNTTWGRNYNQLHFIDKKTNRQRCQLSCLNHTAVRYQRGMLTQTLCCFAKNSNAYTTQPVMQCMCYLGTCFQTLSKVWCYCQSSGFVIMPSSQKVKVPQVTTPGKKTLNLRLLDCAGWYDSTYGYLNEISVSPSLALDTFPMFNSAVWLVATLLASTAIGHFHHNSSTAPGDR